MNFSVDKQTRIYADKTGLAIWFLTAANFAFFIQALRDILIAPGILPEIMPLVIGLLVSPIAAVILTWLWKPPASVIIGTAAVIAGRALLFSPNIQVYFIAEITAFAGFSIFFVGLISLVNQWAVPDGERLKGAALISAGLVFAAAFQLFLRYRNETYKLEVVIGLSLLAAVCALKTVAAVRSMSGGNVFIGSRGAAPALKTFALLLLGAPMYFLLTVFGKPEILAARSAASYSAVVMAVFAGLGSACAAALFWESAGAAARKALGALLLIGNIAACAYFYFLYQIPEAGWQLAAVAASAAVAGLDLYRIIAFAVSQRSRWLTPVAGLSLAAAALVVVGVENAVLIENHISPLSAWIMAPLAAFALLTAFSVMPKRDGNPAKRHSGIFFALALILIYPLGVLFHFFAARGVFADAPLKVEPLVFASLYTWYATPDGVLGRTYPGIDFKKEGAPSDFVTEVSKMNSLTAGGGSGLYEIAGVSDGNDMNAFTIGFDFAAAILQSKPHTYITIAYKLNRASKPLFLEITDGGKAYTATLPGQTQMAPVQLDWPYDFKAKAATGKLPEGAAHLSIALSGDTSGPRTMTIDYLRFSRWGHYDEDYRAYYDKAKKVYYNDPPYTLATAHRVQYTGKQWPDIKPYSPNGYYDSLDPDVMESQLKLMVKGGIDVAMYMHPDATSTIKMGMDIIRREKLPLRVAWYYHVDDENSLIQGIKDIAGDPLYLKVKGRPVVILGRTGMRYLPHARFIQKLNKIRAAGIFVVGDNYAPPKEEMLSLMDGHYYYDTTGFYRSRWGGRDIQVSKPDGSFRTGYGHLRTIFEAISLITHAHGGVFLATVIPACDNLAVHGYLGSPLADGHPGTVVKRQNGATYAETWQAAIDAKADWVDIVSWNELHEGTEIEPTMEDGVRYVELTREWSKKFHAARAAK
ncbi:MAG: hypothetical protein WCX65_00300 [bacterium]